MRQQPIPLIRYSDDLLKAKPGAVESFCIKRYYHRACGGDRRACEMLRSVFEAYVLEPDSLGEAATKRIESEGLHRYICDYIAE